MNIQEASEVLGLCHFLKTPKHVFLTQSKKDVAEILGECSFLRPPKHVFMTREKLWGEVNGDKEYYRGIQPRSKHDSILLSADRDESSPIHEAIHTYGLNELGTEVLTRVIMRKNKVLKNFPLLRKLTTKRLSYKKVDSSKEYPWAHRNEYKNRVQHFILQS